MKPETLPGPPKKPNSNLVGYNISSADLAEKVPIYVQCLTEVPEPGTLAVAHFQLVSFYLCLTEEENYFLAINRCFTYYQINKLNHCD